MLWMMWWKSRGGPVEKPVEKGCAAVNHRSGSEAGGR
jgi:hypothetical protein